MTATTLFWIATACCVVAQLAITVAAARKPRVMPPDAAIPLPAPHRAAEVAWSLIPAVMLALVLLLTWNVIRLQATGAAPTPAIVIEPGGAIRP